MNEQVKKDENGNEYVDIPLSDLAAIDVSDQNIEKMARGFYLGKTAYGRRKDVRKLLEDKVVDRVGRKGKWITDKLFELIEGVYMVDKENRIHGKSEVRYYKVPPNLNAIVYALDRVLGKPKQLSVQASFSLSQLLVGKSDGNSPRTIRSGNSKEISGESDILYPDDLGVDATADQGGM